MEMEDQTLVPAIDDQGRVFDQIINSAFVTQFPISACEGEGSMVSDVNSIFLAPSLILNELYQLYNSKSNLSERNSAIIDYICLIFQNIR